MSEVTLLLPFCGDYPSKLFPIENPPEILTYGTPSRLAPRFGWMPKAFVGSLESVKQSLLGTVLHESCTNAVCCGCRNVPWPSRKNVNRTSFTEVAPRVQVCAMFSCCVRSSVKSPKPSSEAPPDWNLANGFAR